MTAEMQYKSLSPTLGQTICKEGDLASVISSIKVQRQQLHALTERLALFNEKLQGPMISDPEKPIGQTSKGGILGEINLEIQSVSMDLVHLDKQIQALENLL